MDIKLGEYLASLRKKDGFTLRQVEDITEKKVSNAYLSQIESGKIAKPSPNILFALANVYKVPYDELMEMAGYISSRGANDSRLTNSDVTNSLGVLTKEEEYKLLEYLAFIRSKKNI